MLNEGDTICICKESMTILKNIDFQIIFKVKYNKELLWNSKIPALLYPHTYYIIYKLNDVYTFSNYNMFISRIIKHYRNKQKILFLKMNIFKCNMKINFIKIKSKIRKKN